MGWKKKHGHNNCICAKRSFHPCCTSNSDVLCPAVCVREIIDFCEGEQKAASLLLSTGSLSSWFSRIQKWTALKCFKSWYLSVQGPFFGTRLELFLQDVYENNVPPDPPWYGTSWQVFLELTFSDVATAHWFCSCRSGFPSKIQVSQKKENHENLNREIQKKMRNWHFLNFPY